MLQMANKGETVKMLTKEQTGQPSGVTVADSEDDLVLSNGEKYLKLLRDERDSAQPRQRTEAEKNKLRKMMLDLCSAMNELC